MSDTGVPTLAALAERLRANGTVVVPFRDHLEIRLPLFASVQVRIANGQLACEARFGFVPRDRATWASLIGVAVITAVFLLQFGVTPLALMLGFLGVSSTAGMSIRYQLTESCITRVQLAWMLLTSGKISSPLGQSSTQPALGEANPMMEAGRSFDPARKSRDQG